MHASSIWQLGVAGAALLLAVAAARAAEPPPDGNVILGGMLAKPAPKAVAPDVRAPPIAWPRLDRGAVLCRTEDDLLRRAAAMRGEAVGPSNCRAITGPTGIEIVHRAGPGRTEVRVTNPGNETGWTDSWLPANPPPGATIVNAR